MSVRPEVLQVARQLGCDVIAELRRQLGADGVEHDCAHELGVRWGNPEVLGDSTEERGAIKRLDGSTFATRNAHLDERLE